jgi:hypothetical protein
LLLLAFEFTVAQRIAQRCDYSKLWLLLSFMTLKKKQFSDNEVPLFNNAVLYKRCKFWQMCMWLGNEKNYARFSLRKRNRDTAIDKAKKYYHELMAQQLAGKMYFSKTAKQDIEEYLKQREDVEAELIVKGRYRTIKTHSEHWLNYIGRNTMLKEMVRTDCENYLYSRTKAKRNLNVSHTTVDNEQGSINAIMAWSQRRNETISLCLN